MRRKQNLYDEETLRLKPIHRVKIIESVKKVEKYYWTQVQSNFLYNNKGRFLFNTLDYYELIRRIEGTIKEDPRLGEDFQQYTINRWYNYVTSLIIQDFFAAHPRVRVEKNPRSLYRDFFIDGTPFDLKVTFAPKRWALDMVQDSMKNPRKLIVWMYRGGGTDRQHWGPKIFIVLLDLGKVGEHAWEMKRRFREISKLVNRYLEDTGSSSFLKHFAIVKRGVKYAVEAADLLFLVKDASGYWGLFYIWKNDKPSQRRVVLR